MNVSKIYGSAEGEGKELLLCLKTFLLANHQENSKVKRRKLK